LESRTASYQRARSACNDPAPAGNGPQAPDVLLQRQEHASNRRRWCADSADCWLTVTSHNSGAGNGVIRLVGGCDMRNRYFFFITGLVLAFNIYAIAQVTTADVLGRVTDTSGAILPGVMVVIQNLSTGATRSVVSSDTGDYVFNLMIPGQYTITAEAPSFKKSTINLSVSAGDRARADIQLQLGDLSQVVEVEAQSPALQTDSSTLSTVLASQSVQDL